MLMIVVSLFLYWSANDMCQYVPICAIVKFHNIDGLWPSNHKIENLSYLATTIVPVFNGVAISNMDIS